MPAIWNSAWILLVLGNLFWAGNVVIGRAVAGEVPPIALAYWRWTGAFLLALVFAWPRLRRDLPAILRAWPVMLLLSASGVAAFNTLAYIGLNMTSALNVLLLQSVMPLLILVWAFALFRERPSGRQSLAILISLLGVAAIASRGSAGVLLHLRLNPGDVWVMAALGIYALYAVLLRRRPVVHPLSFLVAAMGIGSCMILPFYVWELAQGRTITGGAGAYAAIAYTAVFPSLIAYLCFNRGVELIGAARAGQSIHLMPVCGSALAVLFLGERFELYHGVGVVLIVTGILLATIGSLPTRVRPADRASLAVE
jgi:drug/metabolite transporter (DMT)-like permease